MTIEIISPSLSTEVISLGCDLNVILKTTVRHATHFAMEPICYCIINCHIIKANWSDVNYLGSDGLENFRSSSILLAKSLIISLSPSVFLLKEGSVVSPETDELLVVSVIKAAIVPTTLMAAR